MLGGEPGGALEVDWVALGDAGWDAVGGAGLPVAVDDRVRLLVAPRVRVRIRVRARVRARVRVRIRVRVALRVGLRVRVNG